MRRTCGSFARSVGIKGHAVHRAESHVEHDGVDASGLDKTERFVFAGGLQHVAAATPQRECERGAKAVVIFNEEHVHEWAGGD